MTMKVLSVPFEEYVDVEGAFGDQFAGLSESTQSPVAPVTSRRAVLLVPRLVVVPSSCLAMGVACA
jgi:hypothetical protein